MNKIKTKPLSWWTLWYPLWFAIITFIFMIVAVMISGAVSGQSTIMQPMTSILTFVAFITGAGLLFLRMPRDPLDQRSLIALTNIQVTVAAVLLFTFLTLIAKHHEWLALKLALLSPQSDVLFAFVLSIWGIFLLYLCGLLLSNVYAKYRRCRSMGIAPWRIICSMPFGFSLLWAPGYILSDKQTTAPNVPMRAKWYARFTDWIARHPVATCISFIATVLMSQIFFGYRFVLLVLAMTTIFAIWFRIVGDKAFRRGMPGRYATTAVILNIVLIIGLIIYANMHPVPVLTPAGVAY